MQDCCIELYNNNNHFVEVIRYMIQQHVSKENLRLSSKQNSWIEVFLDLYVSYLVLVYIIHL